MFLLLCYVPPPPTQMPPSLEFSSGCDLATPLLFTGTLLVYSQLHQIARQSDDAAETFFFSPSALHHVRPVEMNTADICIRAQSTAMRPPFHLAVLGCRRRLSHPPAVTFQRLRNILKKFPRCARFFVNRTPNKAALRNSPSEKSPQSQWRRRTQEPPASKLLSAAQNMFGGFGAKS